MDHIFMFGKAIFMCYHCGRIGVSREKVERHIEKQHKLLKDSVKTKASESTFTREIMNLAEDRTENFYCLFCTYETEDSTSIEQHITAHIKEQTYGAIEKEKSYECPLCLFELDHVEVLRHFEIFHPWCYVCPHDDFAAPRIAEVEAHIKSAHTPKICPYCKYSTLSSDDLVIHIKRNHLKAYFFDPFQCPFCDFLGSSSYEAQVHAAETHMGFTRPLN